MTKAEQDQSPPVDPNLSSVVPPSTGPDSASAANLLPVVTANPAPGSLPSDDSHVDTDPNGLEFSESAYFCEVLTEEDCGVWMAAAEHSDGIDFAPPAAPQIFDVDSGSLSGASTVSSKFGECMHCQAIGYAYTKCFDCEDLFYPVEDSSSSNAESVASPVFVQTTTDEIENSDNDSSVSSVSLGVCKDCNALGYFHIRCATCADLLYPNEAVTADEEAATNETAMDLPVVMEEERASVSVANLSLDPTKTNSTTSAYLPTYFDYFDAISEAPSPADPFYMFMDCAPCPSTITLEDDDCSYQFNPTYPIDDDDTDAIYDTVAEDDHHNIFYDSIECTDDESLSDSLMLPWMITTIHWLYTMTLTGLIFPHSLMSPRMLTIFHWLYTMTLTSLTWILLSVIHSLSYSLSARPYSLALTLFWDTLIYYRHPPVLLPTGTQTRKFKRYLSKRPHVPLLGFPWRWMLFTMCIALNGSLGFTHPATTILHQMQSTSQNVVSLTSMVDFTNPGTFGQYHSVRFKQFRTGLSLKDHDQLLNYQSPLPTYREYPSFTSDLEPAQGGELSFFDAFSTTADLALHVIQQDFFELEELVVEEEELSFFETFSHSRDLELHEIHQDYFNASIIPISMPFNDMAGISEIMASVYHASGPVTNADHESTLSQLPSPAAYNTATGLLGTVDLKPLTPGSPPFPVIFDSGASLAISPCTEDFVGPIRKLPHERRLEGMAAGMLIEGIGTVRWTFKADDKYLVVNSRCYYVPDSKARLISPQRLFNKSQGITGKFIVTEDHASLDFDGLPPLKRDFDINSHLPTGLAKNQSQLGSPIQANLAILSKENQNLTPSQKLLLEWHFRFGHKSVQSIQRYFRNVPFVGDRFKAAGKCICPRCATCEFAKGHHQPTKGNAVTINKKYRWISSLGSYESWTSNFGRSL